MSNLTPNLDDKFVGIQVSPISFIDEGIDTVLDTLKDRVGVNVLMLGSALTKASRLPVTSTVDPEKSTLNVST